MAIFPTVKTAEPITLGAALAAKGAELRDSESAQATNADAYLAAAAAARTASETAAKHADAVERAIAILFEAGVSL